MSRGLDAVRYLPEYMAQLREIKELYNALQDEFDLMYACKDHAMGECFVMTCEDLGMEKYEKLLSLVPEHGDSREDRRFRILAALNGDTPYTFERVLQKLIVLCGEGNVTMEYAKDIYTLRVMIKLEAKRQFSTVLKMLGRMLPCNISLKCSLAYNTHRILSGFTHGELSAYTQKQLKEEVIV